LSIVENNVNFSIGTISKSQLSPTNLNSIFVKKSDSDNNKQLRIKSVTLSDNYRNDENF